ncbi:MAG: hypothetical protein V8K32_10090 [Candidatus Electrothrix gigas]
MSKKKINDVDLSDFNDILNIKFYHRKILDHSKFSIDEFQNPYIASYDSTEIEDKYISIDSVDIYLHLPNVNQIAAVYQREFTPISAICTMNSYNILNKVKNILTNTELQHLNTVPLNISPALKKKIIRGLPSALSKSFLVSFVFPKLFLAAGRKNSDIIYQTMISLMLIPLIESHKRIEINQFNIYLPEVGGEKEKKIESFVKKALRACNCMGRNNNNKIYFSKDDSHAKIIVSLSRFFAWTVARKYNNNDTLWIDEIQNVLSD